MDHNDVEICSVKTAFQGYFRIEEYHLRIRQFDGAWSGEFSRELFCSGPAVVVILFDPQRDEVVLVEQFRLAPFAGRKPCWMLEFVAGKIEPGEAADNVARRETLEESGCQITALERITEYYVSPGGADELITLFVGKVDAGVAGGVFGLAEEDENIRVKIMPFAALLALADKGELLNMNTYLGTLWLARNRDDLVKRWLS